MLKTLVAASGSFLLVSAAHAATIDVDNLLEATAFPASGLSAGSFVSTDRGPFFGQAFQNWTVTKSGRLERLDIFGSADRETSLDNVNFTKGESLLVTLTILSGGHDWAPGNVELGAVTKSLTDLGAGQFSTSSFDLSGLGISASQGDLLTFRMSVETCPQIAYCNFGWGSYHTFDGVGTTNGYEGGRAFTLSQAGLFSWNYDLNFRTWVSAVPEPSTWAMMIVGFGAVGSMVRTTRRRNALSVA